MKVLKSMGERVYDLVTNIFRSYCVASDTLFFRFTNTKKVLHDYIEYIIT